MEQGLGEHGWKTGLGARTWSALWRCERHGKLIVAGRTDYVSNVAIVFDEDPNLLIAEVALPHDMCSNGNIKVAVAAWDKTLPKGRKMVQDLGVRVLGGEFHRDVRDFLAGQRRSCRINLVAWKPWRISKRHWAISTSRMFALGGIANNQILWDRPDHWESLPDLAHESSSPRKFVKEMMGIDATMMGEYPANSNDWNALKYRLSTSPETKDKDTSYHWSWLWRISQQPTLGNQTDSEQLVISALLKRPR